MPSPRPASLARRALPALLLTGASAAFLSVLDRPAATTPLADPLATSPLEGSTATTEPDPAPATEPDAATTEEPIDPSTTVPSSVPATPTCTGRQVDGPSVQTRFGPVQVAAIVADDGELCDVAAIASPSGDRRSAAISAQAIPTLDQRAVDAQSADFQGVSGATYTSDAYRSSLQALLDGQ